MNRKTILAGILSAALGCGSTAAQEASRAEGAGHAAGTIPHTVVQTLKEERIRFLQSLPPGLQQKQEAAILAALEGRVQALEAVRNARNTAPAYPQGVQATEPEAQPVRLYLPARTHGETGGKLPLLVYLHGGGWVFGSPNSCAAYCIQLAQKGIAVLAVDYPLAPEHPFPAALDVCNAALDYALEQAGAWGVDSRRVFIGGDSAGGNLAAAVALLRIRQDKPLPCGLVLYYPVVKGWNDEEATCWQAYGKGYGLDAGLMAAMFRAYTGTHDARHPLISPIEATDCQLARFPPVLLVGGTHDILYGQSQAFAAKLHALGVRVQTCFLPEACHLFITVEGQPTARKMAAGQTLKFINKQE